MIEFHKILVPVIDSEASNDAIRLACQLAKKEKAKVWAIYVVVVKRTLPLNVELEPEIKKAEDILDRVEGVADEQDYKIETDLLQARDAGSAIIDEAIEREVDVIIMGIESKRRFGEFSLGSAVPYVLKNAPCHVILNYHYAA